MTSFHPGAWEREAEVGLRRSRARRRNVAHHPWTGLLDVVRNGLGVAIVAVEEVVKRLTH